MIRHKSKNPGHCASQCQMQTEAVNSCSYCGRYCHSEAACYMNQADEAKVTAQNQNTEKVQILKMEVAKSVD